MHERKQGSVSYSRQREGAGALPFHVCAGAYEGA